jgi:tetratricopeptide (TPR) repeat protein
MEDSFATSVSSDLAIDSISSVLRSSPNLSINSVLMSVSSNIVQKLFKAKQYDRVIEVVTELLKTEIYPHLLKARGESYLQLNLLHKGIEDLSSALDLDADCYKTHNNIALAYKEVGLLDLASQHLEDAIKLNPTFAQAHNNYGNVKAEQADMDTAESSYLRSIKLDPNCAASLWNLHSTCSDIDNAKILLEACLEQDAGYEPAVYTLATINALKGNTKFLDWMLSTEIASDSTLRSISWLLSLPVIPHLEFNRWRVFDYAIGKSLRSRAFYEFGVWMGQSFRYLQPHYKKAYGFDTFEGLPEDWHNVPSGTYSSFGKVPRVDGAEFIVGAFSNSLPVFFDTKRPQAGLINFDADLYSSTLDALNHSKSVIDDASILVFDELIINENWEEDEYKALKEFCSSFGLKYHVMCVSLFTKQVVLRVSKLSS